MRRIALILAVACSPLCVSACAPVTVTKTYTEEYVDPHTGKKITTTESITQSPENRMPIHVRPELYQ